MTEQTKTYSTKYGASALRLLRALGNTDDGVTGFTLDVAGNEGAVTLNVTRYVTEEELAALTAELEANPITLTEHGRALDGERSSGILACRCASALVNKSRITV